MTAPAKPGTVPASAMPTPGRHGPATPPQRDHDRDQRPRTGRAAPRARAALRRGPTAEPLRGPPAAAAPARHRQPAGREQPGPRVRADPNPTPAAARPAAAARRRARSPPTPRRCPAAPTHDLPAPGPGPARTPAGHRRPEPSGSRRCSSRCSPCTGPRTRRSTRGCCSGLRPRRGMPPRPAPQVRRRVHHPPARGGHHPGRAGHGHHHAGRRAAARHGRGHRLHRSSDLSASSGPRSPTWSTASPSWTRSSTARRPRPRRSAR